MAKRVDPLKAKAAKQKKMAIILCVVFAAVLAFQGPKTLKMLKGPQRATSSAAAATPAATPTAAPVAGAPVAAGTAAPAAGEAQPAVLVDSDVPAEAADGQLRSFELFQSKDPFAQQNVPTAIPAAPATPANESAEFAGAGASSAGGTVIAPPPGQTGSAPATTPGTTAPAAPAVALAAATSISVNGVAGDVAAEATFPAAAPTFVLVSVAKDGKSVQIGVAGGSYADGAATIKLTLGKPLTLRNTADGSQFVLLLNTVAGFPSPQK